MADRVRSGVLLGLLLTIIGLLAFAASTRFADAGFYLLIGFGVSQVVWVGPAVVCLRRRRSARRGVLMVAEVCFVLGVVVLVAMLTGRL